MAHFLGAIYVHKVRTLHQNIQTDDVLYFAHVSTLSAYRNLYENSHTTANYMHCT